MKRMIKANYSYTRDINDDYLEAKRFVDNAKNAMIYLQTMVQSPADRKLFFQYAAQLGKISADIQSHLNYYNAVNSSEVINADDDLPKGYYDEYYGQTAYEEYGDLVSKQCSGMIISKRADEGEEPGGLIYEAERLGIEDFFDLLKCLEGMCYNGKAVEISDYQYKVL